MARLIIMILAFGFLGSSLGCRMGADPSDECGPLCGGECGGQCDPLARLGSALSGGVMFSPPEIAPDGEEIAAGEPAILEPVEMETIETLSPESGPRLAPSGGQVVPGMGYIPGKVLSVTDEKISETVEPESQPVTRSARPRQATQTTWTSRPAMRSSAH